MNRLLSRLCLGALLCVCAGVVPAKGQTVPPIPMDTAIRYGVLPNGLTYMVRHNEYPKGQADFFIAQKVGSILEEDNQRGLAHFLEHMAFNGTKNFPDNTLREWLASKGVQFGRDLNAYTSFDETVYNISAVPVTSEAVVDSCLLILHDWAADLTLADDAIESERGVIQQEWRARNHGMYRIQEKLLPSMFPDSARYGNRMPIGTMEVVMGFKPDALRAYYHKWYRPDNQGIIVVGDINADSVVDKIKALFGPISMPENPAKREYFTWDSIPGTNVAIGIDPEQQVGLATMSFISDAMPDSYRNTMAGAMANYMNSMVSTMINVRLGDIANKADSPLLQGNVRYGSYMGFVKLKDALGLTAVAKDGDPRKPLETVYREMLRAQRGGFQPGEFERAKADLLAGYEKRANNEASNPSTSYANEYVDHFLNNSYVPGLRGEYELMKRIAGMIPLDAVNAYMKELVTPDNRQIFIAMPEREGLSVPTEQEIKDLLAAVDAETIEPYKEAMREDPLIAVPPKAGKVKSVKQLPEWGAEEWTLSNGAKVVLKTTKFKEDEVRMLAMAKGGTGAARGISDESILSLPYILGDLSGGTYNTLDLAKYNSGKNISISPFYNLNMHGFRGTSSVKNLPDLLENFYAMYTTPYIDPEESAATVEKIVGIFENSEKDPSYNFSKYIKKSLYKSPREQMLDVATIRKASREEVMRLVSSSYSNPAAYTFYFVGNVDADALRPLVEKYIASLPKESSVTDEVVFDPDFGVTAGTGRHDYKMAMEVPQVYAYITATATMPFSARLKYLAEIAQRVFTSRLVDKVREEMGAVYSISSRVSISRTTRPNVSATVATYYKPELAEQAFVAVDSIFHSMAAAVTPEEFAKAREIVLKDIKEDSESNSSWMNDMSLSEFDGVNTTKDADKVVSALTPKDVTDFMDALLKQGNYRTVVLAPEAKESTEAAK